MNVKRKGNAGERELLEILSEHGKAIRNDQRYIGGKDNPDISFSDGFNRYHVECKRVERLNMHEAIRQAERDASENMIPVVVHRRNREPWYITMRLFDFLNVIDHNFDHNSDYISLDEHAVVSKSAGIKGFKCNENESDLRMATKYNPVSRTK